LVSFAFFFAFISLYAKKKTTFLTPSREYKELCRLGASLPLSVDPAIRDNDVTLMYICGRLLLKQREADPAASGINVLARALIVAVNGSAHVAAAPGGGPSEAAASPAARRAGPKHRQASSCPAVESVAYALYSGIIKALGRFPAHQPVLEAAERAIACVAEGLNGISVPVAVPETTVAARIAQIVDHAWTVLMVIAQPERASNLEFNRRFRALLLFFWFRILDFF
jgi:hypothetical protein